MTTAIIALAITFSGLMAILECRRNRARARDESTDTPEWEAEMERLNSGFFANVLRHIEERERDAIDRDTEGEEWKAQ